MTLRINVLCYIIMAPNTTAYNLKYYTQNKQKIILHLGERRMCDVCNREYALYNLSRRRKSKKQLKNLETIKMT